MKKRVCYKLSLAFAIVVVATCAYFSYPVIPTFKVKISNLRGIAGYENSLLLIDKAGGRFCTIGDDQKVTGIYPFIFVKAPDIIEDIDYDGNFLYLAGNDLDKRAVFYTRAHIEQYDRHGKHVRTIYNYNIPAKDRASEPHLVTLYAVRGKFYFVVIENFGYRATVLVYDAEKGEARKLTEFDAGYKILFANYDPHGNKLHIVDRFNRSYEETLGNLPPKNDIVKFSQSEGEARSRAFRALFSEEGNKQQDLMNYWPCPLYEKDGSCHSYAFFLDFADEFILYNAKTGKTQKISEFPCSNKLIAFTLLHFIALVWLFISLLYWIVILAKKHVQTRSNMRIIYACCAIFAICALVLYYSMQIRSILIDQYKLKVSALWQTAVHDIGHLTPSFNDQIKKNGLKGYLAQEERKTDIETATRHLAAVCKDMGEYDGFYVRIMLMERDGALVSYIDTLNRICCGYEFSVADIKHYRKIISEGGWYTKDFGRGKIFANVCSLRGDDGSIYGIIETGYNTNNINSIAFRKALHAIAMLFPVFLYLLHKILLIYHGDKQLKAGGEP